MDGFAQNDNVLVIAATNRRDVLDNALLRPGRFDRIVNIPLPDTPSRLSILNVHCKNKNISQDVDLSTIAELTSGFSGGGNQKSHERRRQYLLYAIIIRLLMIKIYGMLWKNSQWD